MKRNSLAQLIFGVLFLGAVIIGVTYFKDPSALPIPPRNIIVEILPDGSTEIADLEVGYQFTLPPGWVALELSQEDIDQIIAHAVEEIPLLAEHIGLLEQIDIDSNEYRSFAFDLNEGHFGADFVTNLIAKLKPNKPPLSPIPSPI